jgi:hypothetical protein
VADQEPSLVLTEFSWAKFTLIALPVQGEPTATKHAKNVLYFDYDIFTPHYSDIVLEVDREWRQAKYPLIDNAALPTLAFPSVTPSARLFYDSNQVVASDLGLVFREILGVMQREGVHNKRAQHVFTEPTFVPSSLPGIPHVKINSVTVTMEVRKSHQRRLAQKQDFAEFVFQNLITGKTQRFVGPEE